MRRAALLFLFLTGCPRSAPLPLEASLLGATATQVLPDGSTRWWYDAPATPSVLVTGTDAVEVRWEHAEATVVSRHASSKGTTVTLARPPDGEHGLVVTQGPRRATFQVRLRPSTSALVERFQDLATREPATVEAALAALPPEEWPWGCLGLARASAAASRVDAYLRCADGAGARGFTSERTSRRIAAVFWARRLGSWAKARALVSALEAELATVEAPRLRSQFHYQQGLLFADVGDVRQAAAVLEVAIAEADAAERPDEAALYRASLAVALSEAGRHERALELASHLDARDTQGLSEDDRLALRSNVTWVRLRALAQGASLDTESLHAQLIELAEAAKGARQEYRPTVLANLAFLEFELGQLEAATHTLSLARAETPASLTPESTFLDWLEGRLALRRRDAKGATAAFEAMLRRAEQATPGLFTDASWRAQLGRAEALLLGSNSKGAAAALQEARRALASQARTFAEPGERVVFFEDRRRAVAEAVERFADARACDEAFRLADDGQAWLARSFESDRRVRLGLVSEEVRTRFEQEEERYAQEREAVLADEPPRLASVAELEAWKAARQTAMARLRARATALSAVLDDATVTRPRGFEPASLEGDEALLEVFQTPSAKRAFFVRRGRVSCLASPDALEGKLLAGVRHLFVVDGGVALWPSDALVRVLETSTLTFLPSAQWLQQPRVARGTGALVVGDARFDLPHARVEAKAVADTLHGELVLGDAATLSAVTSGWSGRAVLHVAGHGRLTQATPWEARLDLAKGQQLDFELLVSKRPTPWLVVLSGCETGASQRAPADAIGLAEGFLAGGTSAVLATTFELADSGASRFVERFYRLGGAVDPPEAYRQAVREAIAAKDEGWRVWKLFGHRPPPH